MAMELNKEKMYVLYNLLVMYDDIDLVLNILEHRKVRLTLLQLTMICLSFQTYEGNLMHFLVPISSKCIEGVKEVEAKWIGWVGVNVPDEVEQGALTKSFAEKIGGQSGYRVRFGAYQ
ncbi:hypothetical protein Tco_1434580, partial [Tanacetum coccineum]